MYLFKAFTVAAIVIAKCKVRLMALRLFDSDTKQLATLPLSQFLMKSERFTHPSLAFWHGK